MYITKRELLMLGSVGAVAIAIFSSRSRDNAVTQNRTPPANVSSTTLPGSKYSGCGEVIDQCDSQTELKVPRCQDADMAARAKEALGVPLRIQKCKDVYDHLSEGCATGCSLDQGSVLIVPGQIKMKMISGPDESGSCLMKAERQVSFRGVCRN